MNILEQCWSGYTRLIITDGDRGSVMVEMYMEEQNFQSKVWLYALYVRGAYRRVGIASRLMDAAEKEIRMRGYDAVSLDWKARDTPREILCWYMRRGYEEVDSNWDGTHVLLRKRLK